MHEADIFISRPNLGVQRFVNSNLRD